MAIWFFNKVVWFVLAAMLEGILLYEGDMGVYGIAELGFFHAVFR